MPAGRLATFEVYGTLTDWNGGIGRTLAGLWPGHDAALLVREDHELGPAVESETRTATYRGVMALAPRRRGCAWINRDGERSDARSARELPDLARIPDTLGELVP